MPRRFPPAINADTSLPAPVTSTGYVPFNQQPRHILAPHAYGMGTPIPVSTMGITTLTGFNKTRRIGTPVKIVIGQQITKSS